MLSDDFYAEDGDGLEKVSGENGDADDKEAEVSDPVEEGGAEKTDTIGTPTPGAQQVLQTKGLFRTVFVVIIAAGLFWFGTNAISPSTGPDATGGASTTTTSITPVKTLQGTLTEAAAYKAEHKTFRGWVAPENDMYATGNTTVVLSTKDGDLCYIAGILANGKQDVKIDKTGAGCTETEIQKAQYSFDVADHVR